MAREFIGDCITDPELGTYEMEPATPTPDLAIRNAAVLLSKCDHAK
jgi:hypothetical protein